MNKDEVLKLATLARVGISESEAETLSTQFEEILGYVGEVKKVAGGKGEKKKPEDFALKNVLREDVHPHESGVYTEAILKNAPQREGQYIKVQKIL